MLPLLSSARVLESRQDTDSLDLYGRCLQHAMWTIATAFSSQFEIIRDRLYTKTRQMLDKMDLAEPYLDTRRVEPTQAWILIVFYELMKTNYHCAWLSAGRVFRREYHSSPARFSRPLCLEIFQKLSLRGAWQVINRH